MNCPALVLVETGFDDAAGHRQRTLTALASGRAEVLVVLPSRPGPQGERLLVERCVTAVTPPTGRHLPVRALLGIAVLVESAWAVVCTLPRLPQILRRPRHQATQVTRAMREALCLREVARLAGQWDAADAPRASVVILTANATLPCLTALVGGPHARFVHEVDTRPGPCLRAAERIARRLGARAVLLAPTAQVRDELVDLHPSCEVLVRPFAVAEDDDRIPSTRVDSGAVRTGPARFLLVGGWWPAKDVDVLDRALPLLSARIALDVVGAPLDPAFLERWARLDHVDLTVHGAPVSEGELRGLYADADASLVPRRKGVARESGLIVDAVRLGVPLVVSDADAHLAALLAPRPWAQVYTAGSASSLAAVLEQIARSGLPRPPRSAVELLGVPGPDKQVAFLRMLPASSRRSSLGGIPCM